MEDVWQKRSYMEKTKEIPLYTKVGWVVAWVIMLVILAMIMRNCAWSVIYGRITDQQTVGRYHDRGLADGRAGTPARMSEPVFENPVLRKAYNKGYREGLDEVRLGQEAPPIQAQ